MKNIKYLYLIVLIGFLFTSCQEWIDKDEVDIEYSAAWPITGEWYVSEYYDDGAGGLINAYGPYNLNMYNSSFSEDSVWVDNIYDFGIKLKIGKTATTTFSATGVVDVNQSLDDYFGAPGFTYDVLAGQILDTDSIVMNIIIYAPDGSEFDNYYEAGYRKTGFEGFE